MKITADTNVLVRAVMRDDADQARIAEGVLKEADLIAVPLPCLCEFVWVLVQVYGLSPHDAGVAIRALAAAENVEMNMPAVEAGLAMLDSGGDFADGVIAYEGRWLGGDIFISFDGKAVQRLHEQGLSARLL